MIRHGAVFKFDDEQKMGYAVFENQWFGYGNEKSMIEKVASHLPTTSSSQIL